jgi:hypothetical protein
VTQVSPFAFLNAWKGSDVGPAEADDSCGQLPAEVVGSSARAAGFHLKQAALRRTGDKRLLAWARTYVARASG